MVPYTLISNLGISLKHFLEFCKCLGLRTLPRDASLYAYKRESSKTKLVDKPKEYKQSTSHIYIWDDLKESKGLQYALLRVLGQYIYKPNLFP